MAGPIFVVELEPGLWLTPSLFTTSTFEKAKHFPSEIQAQCSLEHYRRYGERPNARIVRIDE